LVAHRTLRLLALIEAHKWLNLAASRVPAADVDIREKVIKGLDTVATMMTPDQIAEAQRLAREWKKTQP
jgi:hypothetical protein